MPKKVYVLDTSVLLYAPYALKVFDKNEVCIPMSVIAEMNRIASKEGPNQRNAILFGRNLDEILDGPGRTSSLENGGQLFIHGLGEEDIYTIAGGLGGVGGGGDKSVVIVSRNPNVRVMAKAKGIFAEPFRHEQSELTDKPYTGRCHLFVSGQEMATFSKEKFLALDAEKSYSATDDEGNVISENYLLSPNEYVILTASDNPSSTMLGRYDATRKRIVTINSVATNGKVYGVTPRNVGQKFALDALLNPEIPLVILRGPAGTAKSFLSMAAGLEQVVEQHLYEKVLLTRPNTKMDNDIGYLKGDEVDKTMPILRGMLDNVENLSKDAKDSGEGDPFKKEAKPSTVESLMTMGVLEMQSMAYMRGRSIVSQYIVVDEMQNSTPTQALSIITRAGEGTKIVICGDTEQIDTPFMDKHSNGLALASEKMKQSPLCAQITFTEKESTRSPLAQEAIKLMGQRLSD